jgi:GT2 family glycosyltransferase
MTLTATPSVEVPRRASRAGDPSADVSVIIVNRNARRHLRASIASVLRETRRVTFEIIVVDNASADGSAQMVRREFPGVTLIANAESRGVAAANNQALRIARGRNVLLLHPDVVLLGNAIRASVLAADADGTIGALGCQVLVGDLQVERTCFRFPSAAGVLFAAAVLDRVLPARWFGGGPEMRNFARVAKRDVDVVSGMFLLVRREVLDRVGLLDEAYVACGEDADWCFRIRKAGWRCVFDPLPGVRHDGGGCECTALAPVRMHVQREKSVLIFLGTHRGFASRLAAKTIFAVSAAARAAACGVASLVGGGGAARSKARCSAAALRFHLTGREPAV